MRVTWAVSPQSHASVGQTWSTVARDEGETLKVDFHIVQTVKGPRWYSAAESKGCVSLPEVVAVRHLWWILVLVMAVS